MKKHLNPADYSQPNEYRFSELSLTFMKRVTSIMLKEERVNPSRICDAYAGCGIIGCQLAERFLYNPRVDFIELQEEVFGPHLIKNSEHILNDGELHFLSLAQFNLEKRRSFDLIVANPPFYKIGENRISPKPVKARAHAFVEGDIGDLFEMTKKSLEKDGYCFFLFPVKDERDLEQKASLHELKFKKVELIADPIALFLLRHL